MPPTIRIPAGPITPHGSYHILRDRIPQVCLRSYDDTVVFNLMGGLSIPDPTLPERVQLMELSGLIPPWQTIDQKGATQDGTTFIDALYDPIEVSLGVRVKGRDPRHLRKTLNHLIASIDAKKQSELSWTTHEMGRWWAPVRWFRTPAVPTANNARCSQDVDLRLRADDGFWRSYPNVTEFSFTYSAASDSFEYEEDDLDDHTDWVVTYTGGAGALSTNGSEAQWVESGTAATTAVARHVGYTSTTNNQVVEIQLGSFPQWHFVSGGYNDIWARMGVGTVVGTALPFTIPAALGGGGGGGSGLSGVRARFGWGFLQLSYFVNGVETVLRERPLLIPPLPGEKWSLIAGFEGNERMFKINRSGITVMQVKEPGTGSLLGSGYRGAGFGVKAGAGGSTQASPASVRLWRVGDNSTVAQSGFLERINMGDQDAWDRYTCFGPGTFSFGNGPGSQEMVTFGPLLTNQIMQIRTDPRKRGVEDLTSTPPPQAPANFLQGLLDFLGFASGNNVPPLLAEILSLFGVHPPQGNPYSLMEGRFSAPIPARSPGILPQKHYVKVSIDDGNADSKVIAALTPLRRNPF